jgi:hypothetical protein
LCDLPTKFIRKVNYHHSVRKSKSRKPQSIGSTRRVFTRNNNNEDAMQSQISRIMLKTMAECQAVVPNL